MISKLLIANRGEIAVRVIRTAREMGIQTVAVYSEADANAIHTRIADESVTIGSSEPSQSYLRIDAILEAARQTGADAIHPGYGFLSERAEFSEACQNAGVTFVGPPPEAMRKLGAKIESKQLAVSAGVPVTPGFFEIGASDDQLFKAAKDIGFPVMLKASAGGGGRGMRAVWEASDFTSALNLAREESVKAFGDGAMMVEKLVDRPRHIEVQFIADSHGNAACLFERECSIQRRHQKLIEESPSPVLSANPELWDPLQSAVRQLVKAAGYVGAGTAEFIYDRLSKSFYFLEVNARLQVEHPVTEEVTGIDLVEWQLRIASGEELRLSPQLMSGDRSVLRSHAIEVRIIAEDPGNGFMPSIGRVLGWAEPRTLGARFDTGFECGSEVSRYYDSMLAKLIVSADTRAGAISKLETALQDVHILGVKTNICYMLDLIRHEKFRAGDFDTGFLAREFSDWKPSSILPNGFVEVLETAGQIVANGSESRAVQGAWDATDRFRVHKSK